MSDSKRAPRRGRLVKDQPHDLRTFSNLLQQQMRARGLQPSDVAQKTGLREETVRSYIRAQSRPTRESLMLLRLLLGDEIVAPFADTDLVPSVERNYWFTNISAQCVVLHVIAPMTPEVMSAVIKTMNDHGVHEVRTYASSESPPTRSR